MSTQGEEVGALFDGIAGEYETNRLAPWYLQQNRDVAEALGPLPPGTVLDVGCGTGWLLRELARANDGLHGIGIDASASMVGEARTRASDLADSLRFLRGNWETMDINALEALVISPLHTITCVSAMHYFADPAAAFARMHRCLAPGGRVLVLDRARDGSWLTGAWGLAHRFIVRDHVRFYTTAELANVLRDAGFESVVPLRRRTEYFSNGKMFTNLVLMTATRGS